MKFGNFRKGLEIMSKYVDDDEYALCAEHDIIYCGPETAEEVTDSDVAALKKLGWFIDNESGGWAVFT